MKTKNKKEPKLKGQLRPEVKVEEDAPTILISLIESYTNSKEGRYKMTSLKKMTGTDSFLALSDKTKGCQIEPEEDCNQRRLSEEIQRQCGCLPWIFKKVGFEYVSIIVPFILIPYFNFLISRLTNVAHSMRVHVTSLSLRKTLAALPPATACMQMLSLLRKISMRQRGCLQQLMQINLLSLPMNTAHTRMRR